MQHTRRRAEIGGSDAGGARVQLARLLLRELAVGGQARVRQLEPLGPRALPIRRTVGQPFGLERVREPLHALPAHAALASELAQVARPAQREAAQQRHPPGRDRELREQRKRGLELAQQVEERDAGFGVGDA